MMSLARRSWLCNLCLASTGLCVGLAAAPAEGQICGYIQNLECPGCSPTDPGACYCGPNGNACDCLKAPGERQIGTRVECFVANFTYLEDRYAPSVELAGFELCMKYRECVVEEGGSGLNCGTLQGGGASCIPGPKPCAWHLSYEFEAPIWTQGDESCEVPT